MGCNIDKMLIKGIRSFSPENTNVIEFYRPLTIIVGQNGAGKTTIIECLKMACTGELPPNTRSGQSFIHDPKVAGETEVKAQIKLRFMTSTRQPVVVIRSFQLTQKKTTLQFKALDNVLQTINRATGQKEALSYRCADIDRIVPSLMGVSKAILENVIFVHQEESNWPLAEGQVLKKKFDDIFAATKYTKALEALRKLRLEKNGEVKTLRLELDHLKSHKDVAQKLSNIVEEGAERAAKLQRDIASIESQIQELQASMGGWDGQLTAIADYADEVRELRARQQLVQAQNAETHARLLSAYGADDLDISVEELEQWERDLEPEVHDMDAQVKRLQRDIQSKLIEAEAIKEQYTRDVKNQGRLAAEADAHQRNCADRVRFIRQVAAEAGLQVPAAAADGTLSAEALAAFTSSFAGKLAEATKALDGAKVHNRAMDDELGRSIDKLSAELSGAAEGVRMKQEQLRKNDATLAQVSAALDACVVNAGLLEDARQRERDLEARLTARQEALAGTPLEEEGRQAAAALAELAGRAKELRLERDRLASAADVASRMRYKSLELAQKQQQVASMLSGRRAKLDALLGTRGGDLPPAEQLRARVESALAQRKWEVEARGRELKEFEQKVSAAEGQEHALSAQLHKSERELEMLGGEVDGVLRDACGGQPQGRLADCTHAAEAERNEAAEKLAQFNAYQTMSTAFKRHANDHNLCVTCGRPFASEAERQQFLLAQDQQMSAIPSRMEQVRAQMARVDQRMARLKSVQSKAARHDQLRESEVPDLQRRLGELRSTLAAHREALSDSQELYATAESELQEGQKLLQDLAWPVDRLAKEIKELQAQVDAERSQVAVTSDVRTVTDVDRDLEDVDSQRAQHEAKRDDAARKLQRLRDEVSHLRSEYHRAREECMRLSATAEKRTALEAQLQELGADSQRIRAAIAAASEQRRPLEERKAQLAQDREKQRAQGRQREGELEAQLRHLHSLETQLQAKQRAIDEYERAGRADALAKIEKTLRDLQSKQEAVERAAKAEQAKLAGLEGQQRDKAQDKRTIDDLLGYHRAKAQQKAMEDKLNALEAAMGKVGDQEWIHGQYRAAQRQVQELRSKKDQMLGALATINDQVGRARSDLSEKQYDNIDARYREQLIKLKTTEMANNDLDKYHKALEKALLAFHTSKMADINKVVKELWQKTYRNSDIDYIAIKTDAEGGAARSYNYRVVMYCGGAELDMRGRCSAGQKVLACLIIRLALAETFCLNCGILALDEPTTNLDAANAASLAESLRAIMSSRRDQENFQLVVITHDEQFAHLIGTREHCEFLFRITKDQLQHTLVSKEEILD